MNTRRSELDLCRVFACVMVMVIHTGAEIYQLCPIDSGGFAALNFVSTAVRGGLPVFFMLSGALLLGREEFKLRSFLKKHVLRLIGLFFFWSALYAVGSRLTSGTLKADYALFLSIARGHYHMWFIPAIVICYVFMPVLWGAIHGKKIDIRYLLALFFVFGLLWRNLNLTPEPTYIIHTVTVNFSLDWLPYLGYALWGWWLSERELPKHTKWSAPLIYLACTLLAAWGNLWYSGYKGTADGWLFHYLSLPSFIQATCIFCFFSAFRAHEFKHRELLKRLSDETLGVYLIHPLMIKLLGIVGVAVSAERAVLSVAGFTLLLALICFAVTALMKRVPIVKRLV